MAADEVQHGIPVFFGVILDKVQQLGLQRSGVLVALEERQDLCSQGVIHSAVDVVAAQVFPLLAIADFVGSVFPYFPDEQGLRVLLLQGLVELAQERFGQFVDDVQPPTADAGPEPVLQHAVLGIDDEIHVGGRSFFHVGQVVHAPPGFVFVRVLGESVPAVVGGVLGLIGSQAVVPAVAIEIHAVRPCVAEYTVQDDADALLPGSLAQLFQLLLCAQERIYPLVVACVVAMVAAALENGVQVQHCDAQLLQVGQLFPDAGQIASEEIVVHDGPVVMQPAVEGGVVPTTVEYGIPLATQLCGTALAPAEPVREDLVHDGVLEPVRRPGVLVVHRNLVRGGDFRIDAAHAAQVGAVVAVVDDLFFIGDDKVVP